MGLPWPEWGDTAVTLLWLGDELRALRCPCGCGQFADEAHDSQTEGRWVVEATDCYARKALVEWAEAEKPERWTLTGTRLARTEGDMAEVAYDPAQAQRIHDAHLADLETARKGGV